MDDYIQQIIDQLNTSFSENTFVKMTLSNYRGEESDLERVYIRPIFIKEVNMLSFTYRYKTKDITKNFSQIEALQVIRDFLKPFQTIHLFTTQSDVFFDKKRTQSIKTSKPTFAELKTKEHDNEKQRLIDPHTKFLRELDITSITGQVKADKFDKYKQINKFIEIVDGIYKSSSLSDKESFSILDLGSGKSYLTFALYHYFKEVLKKNVDVKGVELRKELVDLSNDIANKCEFKSLKFVKDTIKDFSIDKADLVVALHACDTATDDAVIKGIEANAEVIILAPCCHKYVRKQMKNSETMHDILKHGILEQRESEIITDGLRAMTLEYYGYKTQVFEFISSEYTSKNLLLTAVKMKKTKNPTVLDKINEIKKMYAIEDYYLDNELSLDL